MLLWYEPLNIAYEISYMGIRVDKDSLIKQLEYKNELYKLNYGYHKDIVNDVLPLSIGGGIGQSRMCLFMLNKAHIGEVQVSYWDEEDIKLFEKNNIHLL
jgi:aspartate--ammonia ligase